MKTIRISGVITAKSPIHHGGNEKTGSTVGFRRMDMLTTEGVQEVPYIEGNAVRGKMRRLLLKDFLDRIDYTPPTPRMHHFLYSGGNLEKVASKNIGTLNLDMRRQLRSLVIPISILGSSILNQAFAGKLRIGKMYPICKELLGIQHNINTKISFHELMSTTFHTRKDDLHAERDEGTNPQQMLVEIEIMILGTRYTHEIILDDPTPLEESCMSHLLKLWTDNGSIGGKSAIGFGEIESKYNIPKLESPELYLKYLEENREKICSYLDKLSSIK